MSHADIDATLWQEAGHGRHPSQRQLNHAITARIVVPVGGLIGSEHRLAAPRRKLLVKLADH
jgi:hypothetical protein